ncbi:MAG: hypothetical protein HYX69_06100 [Planctomycetia bacterium]|nr:hypothetical protein [Planctomycetia bacterium]
MKRLLILTTAAVLMASSSGCFHWFRRGGSCGQPAPAPTCGAPGAVTYGDPYMAAPGATVMPGPVYSGQ